MISILRNIVRACFDKTFYQQSEKDSFGRRYAHLYVLFMVVILAFLLQLIPLYVENRTKINSLPQEITKIVDSFYPEDLVLKFEDNELSINQPEPYILGENIDFESDDQESRVQNFITIDTSANIDDFDSYQTFALVMKKGIAARQSSRPQEVRYYSFENFLEGVQQPLTFDSVSYGQIVNKLRPYINQLPNLIVYLLVVFAVVAVLVGPFLFASGTLFAIVFTALFGYLVALVMQRKHTYSYIYKLAMYTAIPVIILQQITGFLQFRGFESIWWLISLVILVLFIPPVGGPLAKANQTPPAPMDPPKVA